MSGFVRLVHPEFDGAQDVPDDAGVLAFWKARGWQDAPAPDNTSGAAPAGPPGASEPWADLVHPVTHGTTRVPNSPDVIADFAARGWQVAPPAVDGGGDVDQAPDDPPAGEPDTTTTDEAAPADTERK